MQQISALFYNPGKWFETIHVYEWMINSRTSETSIFVFPFILSLYSTLYPVNIEKGIDTFANIFQSL